MIDDDFLIWYGGPVSSEQGYVLHNLGEFDGDSHVCDGAGLSVNIDSLNLLEQMKADSLPITSARFIVGYCGWAPGQLDDEFLEGVWLQIPFNEELVFKTPAEEMWERAFASVGIHLDLHLSKQIRLCINLLWLYVHWDTSWLLSPKNLD